MMKDTKECWFCKKPLRSHNQEYCEHIWRWKFDGCKPMYGFVPNKFHKHGSIT